MRYLSFFCISASLLMILTACSSGSSPITSGTSGLQPVLAQTTYSNSSLSGTYSVSLVSLYTLSGSAYYSGIGTVQLNGTGSITGGTINTYFSGSTTPCVNTVTGTYSIQSTALGTASLNSSSSTKNCPATDTWQVALAAADGGATIQFIRSDGNIMSGTAIKQ